MMTLERDSLIIRFPEVHPKAETRISFQRTLRIPDDTKEYPLPPGLGRFPLVHTDDFAARLPKAWRERGGVMLPMHRAEAMWISFEGRHTAGYPCAIKIAAGKINAVSGKRWRGSLSKAERDYVVVPGQPWLDGYCVAKGQIRQFVAMPLGAGYTAEEQITGKPEHGGLQLIVYPMKAERFEAIEKARREAEARERRRVACESSAIMMRCAAPMFAIGGAGASSMGLAAGGRMRQDIYADPHGLDAWETSASSRCFVTMLDAAQWQELTGKATPTKAPTAATYAKAGLPWFDYEAAGEAIGGAPELSALKSVAEVADEKGHDPLDNGEPVEASPVITLGPSALAGASSAKPTGSST